MAPRTSSIRWYFYIHNGASVTYTITCLFDKNRYWSYDIASNDIRYLHDLNFIENLQICIKVVIYQCYPEFK